MTARIVFPVAVEMLLTAIVFTATTVITILIWNYVSGSNISLGFAVVIGLLAAVQTPIAHWLLRRFPLLPDRNEHKRRLRELQAERERLARAETE